MKLLKAELVNHKNGRSTIKCRWRVRHFFLARWLFKLPRYQDIEAVYIGGGTVWRLMETYRRVSTKLEERLSDIEAKLLDQRAGNWA